MKLSVNPEFGIELALAVPYAHFLHKNGQLESVETSRGMKPFYFFCDNVMEVYQGRSLDNLSALKQVPNKWIHHNADAVLGKDYSLLTDEEKSSVNGVLDYSEWLPVDFKTHYKNDEFKFDKPTVFITNKFNIEHGEVPMGYFDIECLCWMFDFFKSRDYTVIYKRATNRESEFSKDDNETQSLAQGYNDIIADVNGVGIITDFQLTEYFDNVTLLSDIVEKSGKSYNEVQLKVLANCDKFVSVCGGNSILSSMFGGTVITYIHKGKELRTNYFGENSYFRKLSGANVIPTIDRKVMTTGEHDYSELKRAIEKYY
jgi:hypothetical protein